MVFAANNGVPVCKPNFLPIQEIVLHVFYLYGSVVAVGVAQGIIKLPCCFGVQVVYGLQRAVV